MLTLVSWQLVAGGLLLLPIGLIVEGAPPAVDASAVAGFAWLAVVGTGLAYYCWFRGPAAIRARLARRATRATWTNPDCVPGPA